MHQVLLYVLLGYLLNVLLLSGVFDVLLLLDRHLLLGWDVLLRRNLLLRGNLLLWVLQLLLLRLGKILLDIHVLLDGNSTVSCRILLFVNQLLLVQHLGLDALRGQHRLLQLLRILLDNLRRLYLLQRLLLTTTLLRLIQLNLR